VQQPSQPSQNSVQFGWELIAAFLLGAVSASLLTAVGLHNSLFTGLVTS